MKRNTSGSNHNNWLSKENKENYVYKFQSSLTKNKMSHQNSRQKIRNFNLPLEEKKVQSIPQNKGVNANANYLDSQYERKFEKQQSKKQVLGNNFAKIPLIPKNKEPKYEKQKQKIILKQQTIEYGLNHQINEENNHGSKRKFSFRNMANVPRHPNSKHFSDTNKKQDHLSVKNLKQTIQNSDKIREDGAFPIKLVTVGDACVGKTCMLISYTSNQFPTGHVPTIFQNYSADVLCDSRRIKLWLWDTAGQEEYQKIRLLSYQKADIFLICFSMIDHNSFYNALDKWFPEVNQQCPKALKLFVGTKSDIHSQYQQEYSKKHLAIPLKLIQREIQEKKCSFLMCNSLTQKGLNEVFTTAIRKVFKKAQRCKIQKENQCQMI